MVASDFYEDLDQLESGLNRLHYDGHDIIGLHVLDPLELDFDLDHAGVWVDAENGARQQLDAQAVRAGYLLRFREFCAGLEEKFRATGGDFVQLRTDRAPVGALARLPCREEGADAMNWLFPGFLMGAALIGLPVVLHWLRRKPRDVVRFPSLRFLGASALRDMRRNRLLHWLTLLLRCLAIALLCAAFARPFWGRTPSAANCALVIALDNSMSQQLQGRWEETRRWSLGQLDGLGAGDQAGLLVMQPEPTWVVPMTDELQRVRAALMAARPGYDKTRYARPLRIAGDKLSKTDAGTRILAWAADEQRAGWRGTDLSEKIPPGIQFRFMGVPPVPHRQAAIVSVRPSGTTANSLDVTIRQFQPGTPDQRQLTVRAAERVIAQQSVTLRPGDNEVNIPCNWPTGTVGMRLSLNADDLPADDSAWVAAHGRGDESRAAGRRRPKRIFSRMP